MGVVQLGVVQLGVVQLGIVQMGVDHITGYKCTLNCFEVTSTGFVNTRNQKTLHNLHSFMRKDLKKSVFMSNLNSLAWYGSYQVWLSREDPTFTSPSYLIPHIALVTCPSDSLLPLLPTFRPHLLPCLCLVSRSSYHILHSYHIEYLYLEFCFVGFTTCLGPVQ